MGLREAQLKLAQLQLPQLKVTSLKISQGRRKLTQTENPGVGKTSHTKLEAPATMDAATMRSRLFDCADVLYMEKSTRV